MIKAKTSIPKAESVVAFLAFHGWKTEKKTNSFFILKPPASIKPSKVRLKIPFLFGEPGYETTMYVTLDSVANLYEWNIWSLMNFLTKNNPIEIEKRLKEGVKTEPKIALAS